MENNLDAIEQVMTEKEKIALNFFYEFMEHPPKEFENVALDHYYNDICTLYDTHASKMDIANMVDELMGDAKLVGFVSGYTYAIERLKETLLFV